MSSETEAGKVLWRDDRCYAYPTLCVAGPEARRHHDKSLFSYHPYSRKPLPRCVFVFMPRQFKCSLVRHLHEGVVGHSFIPERLEPEDGDGR